MNRHTPYITISTLLLCMLLGIAAYALPPKQYVASSKLSSGRWRKVEVTQTGMQLLTNAQLKTMGFNDPSKVNIYGYGGRRVSELMSEKTYIDDLPLQPVVRTDQGIIFFGTDNVSWVPVSSKNQPFEASPNPYSLHSWYFVSDRPLDSIPEMPVLDWAANPVITDRTNTFTERLVHEKDIYSPGNTGEWMLGEDFRQQTAQEFKFHLPGLAPGPASLAVGFGASASAPSSYSITVNGEELPTTTSQNFSYRPTVETFILFKVAPKELPNPTSDLTVGIKYNPAGEVYTARLGSISIYYPRHLDITDGSLYFYSQSAYTSTRVYEVNGATTETQIWDVTNPAAPAKINFTLDGNKAIFTPRTTEYREYIAFNPGKVSLYPKADNSYVPNQDLHATATPHMVIITPREYLEHARSIGEMHQRVDGMDTYIVTPEALYNEFSSGSPDVTAYRKALKMWYDRDPSKLKYCLILGRPTYDQRQITSVVSSAGYPRPLTWQMPGEHGQRGEKDSGTGISSYSTDDYIVMLEDNRYSFDVTTAKLSIAVGRMPFRGKAHADAMVRKLLKYVEQPDLGHWRNQITMIADNGDQFAHFKEVLGAYNRMQTEGGERFLYEKILLSGEEPTRTPLGLEYPYSKQRMMQMFNRGTGLVWYVGHANPREWTAEHLFTYTDMNEMTNRYLPIFFTSTCEYSRWDADEVSGGEVIWSLPESGAIALISTSRAVMIGRASDGDNLLDYKTARRIFHPDSTGRAMPIGEALRLAKNDLPGTNSNKLRFITIGDPAMRVINPALQVMVEALDGIDPATLVDPDFPVYKGGGKIKISGTVRRGENLARDFNGDLHITLYDAERVMETVDPEGIHKTDSITIVNQELYNIRTNCVFQGRVRVTNGIWETQIPVTTDIENNFSPANITLYAYSDTGLEANGSCNRLYLYGMEENLNDTEGPTITGMGLNTYHFKPGTQVSPNPIFYASFTDPSGINLASAGVGHSMVIGIDGKRFFTDVRDCFVPSADDVNGGSISYPLTDLEPGRHTLEFTICDNLGNRTIVPLEFVVAISPKPIVYEITTDCNPARTSVTFSLVHDRLAEATACSVSVYDLSGRKVWTGEVSGRTDIETGSQVKWDLRDGSGRRVPRGIYLYRATVETSEGVAVSKTGKLAVTAP